MAQACHGELGEGGGGAGGRRGGGNKREGVLDQLSLQGETPWSAQCVAGATHTHTHTLWDTSFTGIFGFICPG